MSKNIKTVSTLEIYNYGESNKMMPSIGSSYKVKVSDKEGNIITIEKDDALYACVRLSFDSNTGILQLLDAAHDDSVLAEIEMPNADYIYNCRFDEELNSILFDVKALYGDETSTIELDVESLVELYEAGQGIEIGEKNEETGRKPISIKLAEGETILHLSDDGLGIDDKVITDDELEAAISGKADTDYVNEILSALTGDVGTILDKIEAIEDVLGTDIDDPNIDERIDSKADLDEFNDLEEEVGEIEANVATISGNVETLKNSVEAEVERALSAETELNEKIEAEATERKANAVASAEYDSDEKKIKFLNANDEIIDSIDATDFIKDGMVDSVELVEISGNTYIRITWNTDSGKEITDINIGDIFDADNYYNKAEIDEKVIALQDVDTQQWNGINGEITRAMGVESQLWGGINGEIARAQGVEGQLWEGIRNEATARQNADSEIRDSITGFQEDLQNEIEARETADDELRGLIVTEVEIDNKIAAEANRAQQAEDALQTAIDDEATTRQNADLDLGSKYNNLDGRIAGFEAKLQDETDARMSADTAIEAAIAVINDSYASKDYVNGKTAETFDAAVSSAVTDSKDYTDNQLNGVEADLKHYCDSGHTELQDAISANATRINAITNWNGQGDYHDDGNGILDILHKEFHDLIDTLTQKGILP